MRVVQRGDGGGAGIISAHVSPEEKVRGWEKVMGIHLSTRCGLLPAGKNKKSFKSKGKLVLNSFFLLLGITHPGVQLLRNCTLLPLSECI